MKRIYNKNYYKTMEKLNKLEKCNSVNKEVVINTKVKLYETITNFSIIMNNLEIRKILIMEK
jgi:hypothetical protein